MRRPLERLQEGVAYGAGRGDVAIEGDHTLGDVLAHLAPVGQPTDCPGPDFRVFDLPPGMANQIADWTGEAGSVVMEEPIWAEPGRFCARFVLRAGGQSLKSQSGRQDSNLRPSAPKAPALPSCATPRWWEI